MLLDCQMHTDDPVRLQCVGLGAHAVDGQFSGVVHCRRQDLEFHRLAPVPILEANVVDRSPHDVTEWVETELVQKHELVDRQVGREGALVRLLELLEALDTARRSLRHGETSRDRGGPVTCGSRGGTLAVTFSSKSHSTLLSLGLFR